MTSEGARTPLTQASQVPAETGFEQRMDRLPLAASGLGWGQEHGGWRGGRHAGPGG